MNNGSYRPALISWNLTKKCNLRCPHCYMEAGRAAENELTTGECLGLLDEMKALGAEMLILTGGEPLLRKDIYDIARAASSLGLWVVMGTNGVLISDAVAEKMVECGVKGVGISIDSLDPARHNSFRGGPNAWEYSVRALDICRAHGLEVLVQTTVMAMNVGEIPRLIDFAREKGAWSFNLYFLVQTGRGQQMIDLSAEHTEAVLSDLVDAQDRQRPMLVRAKCAPHFKRIAYEKGSGGLESGGCRCRAYAAFGDYLQEDPACTYQPTGRALAFNDITWSASPSPSSVRESCRVWKPTPSAMRFD